MGTVKKQIIHQSFNDFDALTEAAMGWNLEFHKLAPGSFSGELFQLIDPSFIITRGLFSCRLRQLGEPPPGFRTFAVPINPDMHMLWRNQHVSGRDLLVFPENGELNAASDESFDVFTISIKEELLIETAARQEFQGLEKQLQSSEVFKCDRNQLDELLLQLRQGCRLHETDPGSDVAPFRNRIADKLVQLLSSASGKVEHQPTRLRLNAIQQAERYILDHAEDPPGMSEVCAASGVSRRTLEYAFSEYFGINPKAYINAVRLNAAHRQLRAARPDSMHVADAANFWGFWHMGQFAADYRRLFGQRPSTTLHAPSRPCKGTCPFLKKCRLCGCDV